ncbi:flagellum-specific ATP synthase [Iodidimonas nitroreducens]|uniref:Flagellum-specific ATP synthase n=1 Tax=Iodidimonas nitroreducens TaxID=1236968 RepID=A0A5A7N7H8_9PROT|nr:flagellar protein export ATPase FliI [Iodidimonas nitroreducens]GAK32329.1 flagellum-specific ATP synthase [alpha proteobacterium Q-1]GER03330.1 flagellum-specific ATP synthase [Iodidimonas nitroreducens]
MKIFDELTLELRAMPGPRWQGSVTATAGRTLLVEGLETRLAVGDICQIMRRDGTQLQAEVIGFRDGQSIVMPLQDMDGISHGCKVMFDGAYFSVRPHDGWLGRVVNALGQPIDGLGPLPQGEFVLPLRNTPPNAMSRRPVGGKIQTGIKVIDLFTPLCRGQRMGIFAGSGVGKSTLLSMLLRHSESTVNVIGLIGERGREVREFINGLGRAGLEKSIIVAATSDESPLMRKQASYLTLALAEDQRKRGRQVLCVMDSVTRFAMAQREIGLAAGEPPTAKGYPPSVFSELPKLLERAGPGINRQGDVTGIFTVLVDGDDHNEPISDAVRGILDGHMVLSRKLAEKGRFPAIDLLRSLSRMLPDCHNDWENAVYRAARKWMAIYEEREDLIRLGAYKQGSDPDVDQAIAYYPRLEDFCRQSTHDHANQMEAFETLAAIIEFSDPPPHHHDGEQDQSKWRKDDQKSEVRTGTVLGPDESGPLAMTADHRPAVMDS